MALQAGWALDRRRMLRWCGLGAAFALAPARLRAEPAAVATAEEPHHHVIFDNADLRLMRVLIPPGQSTDWHVHAHDYVVTVLRGSQTRTEILGGRTENGEMVTDSVIYAAYEDKPATHRVQNTSTWLNHQMAFEILTPKPQRYGNADRGHEPAFTLVLDNKRVRGWRLKLQPGASTRPVIQKGPGVRVVLSGGRVMDMPANGTGQETDVASGDAAFLPPDTRTIVNGGNGPLDLVEFELL